MTRLTIGALARKANIIGLLSVLVATTSPVIAQGNSVQFPAGDDVDIKTIAPPPEAAPQPMASAGQPPVEAQAPQPAPAPAPPAGSSLQFTPDASAPVRPPADVASTSGGRSGSGTAAQNSDLAASQGSSDPNWQNPERPKAVAPPEVSEPAPLAQVPGSIGQPVAGRLKDPRDTRLPVVRATVKVRRAFKLFAREELIRNLSFRDTPVKEVIAELARRGGLNILIDRSVMGKITGELKDVTLNEAMDSVLAAGGLQNRVLDNNTVIVGTMQAMTQLGLNRPMARAFKLSYAHPFDVAMILHTSVFNRGMVPDFTTALRRKASNSERNNATNEGETRVETDLQSLGEGGSRKDLKTSDRKANTGAAIDEGEFTDENNQTSRPDINRQLRGTSRSQTQEGVGFNNAATDPGTQQIRQFQETPADYTVEQNGGGAICIPDVKNRQIVIVGTADDLAIAEEAIHFIDRRPRQVHVQTSLIEINNQGLRLLGASINLQGQGLSGSILGNGGHPLIQLLPGLGSPARPGPVINSIATDGPNSTTSNLNTTNTTNNAFANNSAFDSTTNPVFQNTTVANTTSNSAALASVLTSTAAQAFTRTNTVNQNPNSLQFQPIFGGTTVAGPFTGLIGDLLPILTTPVAGVTPLAAAQTGFNFLTLSKSAGGRANIATLPAGFGINVNLLLQTNKAKLVANPSVIVSDNTETLITIADEVLHKVTTVATITSVTSNVELTKAGVFLNVLPKVTEDGFITMRLRPQVSAPLGPPQTFSGTTVTLLSIRDIMTQEVRVKDGQTLVLGGLFRESEAAQLAKVPYFAELPVMGALFRNSLKGRNRSELMLLITPKIVEEEPQTASDTTGPKPM